MVARNVSVAVARGEGPSNRVSVEVRRREFSSQAATEGALVISMYPRALGKTLGQFLVA